MQKKKVKLEISPKRFFNKNRRGWNKSGQFYLIAAIVIISVIIGFTSIANYSKKKSSEKMNDLRDELQIETSKILEYGMNNYPSTGRLACINEGDDSTACTTKPGNRGLKEIAEIYMDYTDVENMYFILGDTRRITISAYLQLVPENIFVEGVSPDDPLFQPNQDEYYFKYYTPVGNEITININEIPYTFELKPGMNLYFIISKEGYVATNKI